jgi:hypothetical protein
MTIEQEILTNQYGQGLTHIDSLVSLFLEMKKESQKDFFLNLIDLIQQSKPLYEDIELAIQESKLKPTYTPCIVLQKGVESHNLIRIINLPESESPKALILLLNLFKVAYQRRFIEEKNNPDKWWYWDLGDKKKLSTIISTYGSKVR